MASATPAAKPGAPAGLTATPGDSQVTLSWAAPASDGGAPISDYNVYQGTSPGSETGAPVSGSPVTATSTTVTGLANGTTYYFKVAAVNGIGQGPASAEVSAVPVTRPDPATGLTATPGDSQVTLSWAAPASDGGAPISDYNVYQGTSPGSETGAPVGGSPVTATSTTVTGLANGTTYYFKVAAVNGVGARSGVGRGVGHSGCDAGGARQADRHRGQCPGDSVVDRARIEWRSTSHRLPPLCGDNG